MFPLKSNSSQYSGSVRFSRYLMKLILRITWLRPGALNQNKATFSVSVRKCSLDEC